jgi:hypothetical protein
MIEEVPNTKFTGTSLPADVLDARLTYGARLVLSRDPTASELAVLRAFFEKAQNTPNRPVLVRAALTNRATSSRQLAALTAVASVLLNLDAALTR